MFKLAKRASKCRRLSRTESTAAVSQQRLFYQNKQLELYAAKEANRLTLRQLVSSPSRVLCRSSEQLKR